MWFSRDIKRNYWHKRGNTERRFFYLSEVKWLRYISLAICTLSAAEVCLGQQDAIDSLTTRLKEKLHDAHRVKTLNSLAKVLKYANPDTTFILSSEALSIAEANEWQFGIAKSMDRLGSFYGLKGDYSTALDYYFNALKIYEELGRKSGIAINLGNIGIVYDELADYPRALEYYFKAQKMNEELGDKNGIAANLGNIGRLYTGIGEFEKAEKTLQKALALSKDIGAKEILKYQYEFLSELYDTTNRPAQAFEAYKLYIIYRDSIANEENTKAQTRTEMKYEYEKAELVKEQKEREAARIKAEILSRRDNLQYSIVLICLLVIGVLVAMLGKLALPVRMAEGLIFFSFLILFEFILVLADPYIEVWSSGAPGIKLLFNAGIAALIFPLHAFFEKILKHRLIKNEAK